MKYVILIYSNPASRAVWDRMSPTQRAEGLGEYAALSEDLAASGAMIAGEALADPSRAIRVTAREGRPLTSDGPFAEAKEHLAGFFLIDCESTERAIAYAARVPEAAYGLVEVRPVLELDGPEG